MDQFKQVGRRSNPPSEDFAETRQLLKDERVKNEQLVLTNKRLRVELKQKNDLIADILDDTGRT